MDNSKLTESQMEAILRPESENKALETFILNHIQKDPEAESMFKVIKLKEPESFALKIAHYLGHHDHDIHTRQACAELLGKLLLTDDDGQDLCTITWRSLSVSTQSTIKCILLDRMNRDEESGFIIHELSKTVFKLAVSLLPHNNWPELLPFLIQSLSSTNHNLLKVCIFLVFTGLAMAISETVVSPCVKPLHSLFRSTLNDDTLNLHVRISASKAVISFIQRVLSPNEKERFQDLLPGMMRTLTDAILSSRDAANDMLGLFLQFAKNEPRFFRMQLVDVVHTMFEIAEAENLEELTRYLAVEFLITLAEAKERAPGMMKRLPFFVSRCLAMLLNLVQDIKDDPAWHSAESVLDAAWQPHNFSFGILCINRFTVALGVKSIAHILIEQTSAYLAAPEWEKRHAALMVLCDVASQFCSQVMIKYLEQVMEMVLNCSQDPHPQVRWAACVDISTLLIYSPRHIQEKYHNQVVLAIAVAMDDFHPRVQACALVSLGVLMDRPEFLIPHLDGVVNKLLVLLQNDKYMVHQQALAALAAIAQSAKEHFYTYYDTVMPHLKTILRNADLNSDIILRTTSMEFISLVGVAVGKEKFRDDAKQIMEVFMSLQALQVKVDDHATSYMLRACTRVCICIGKDFLPYMSTLMPILIQYAQLEPDTTISTKSKYYEIFGLNTQVEGTNRPGVLEVKARACFCLSSYADALKEDFHPWLPQAVSILVPLLKFCRDDIIRRYAVEAMPNLLRSTKLAVEKGIAHSGSESYFKEFSDYIILSLVEALHEELVTEICAVMLDNLNHCLQICQPLLNEGQLRRIVDEVKHVITECSNRKKKLMERAKTEDFDAEEAELLREEKEQEDKILIPVC